MSQKERDAFVAGAKWQQDNIVDGYMDDWPLLPDEQEEAARRYPDPAPAQGRPPNIMGALDAVHDGKGLEYVESKIAPAQDAKSAGTATADREASYPIKLDNTSKGPFEAEIVQPAPKEHPRLSVEIQEGYEAAPKEANRWWCKLCGREWTESWPLQHFPPGVTEPKIYRDRRKLLCKGSPERIVVELPEGGGGRKA
jgi:hypothetical protein